jgi:hypothetical protein
VEKTSTVLKGDTRGKQKKFPYPFPFKNLEKNCFLMPFTKFFEHLTSKHLNSKRLLLNS